MSATSATGSQAGFTQAQERRSERIAIGELRAEIDAALPVRLAIQTSNGAGSSNSASKSAIRVLKVQLKPPRAAECGGGLDAAPPEIRLL